MNSSLCFLVLIAFACAFEVQANPAFAGGFQKPAVPVNFGKFAPPVPAASGPSAAKCPQTDGTVPLYVPDPESCTKYTVCSGPFATEMECPPGMHFSAEGSFCTFPALANCAVAARR